MKRKAMVGILAVLVLVSCEQSVPEQLHGYVEADYVDIAPAVAGRLQHVVRRGQHLRQGEPLFELEQDPESLNVQRLEAELKANEALLAEAELGLSLAHRSVLRLRRLASKQFVSEEKLDQVNTAANQAQARVDSLHARNDAIRAELKQLQWILGQKRQMAPVAGWVEDVFYEVGEWVGPQRPVVRLLPEKGIKIRFYVPEARLSTIDIGTVVVVHLDGIAEPLRAKVSYIADRAEFTPPVIYSEDLRAHLVYRVEALPIAWEGPLHPGQPVDIDIR
ncbi:MAG: efflux RND transporter periplasmic adaptor subunit [Zetaproteobacteria bacterium]|nr:MAG: efflux RND transporter periplasmic adaptor subunit [Zetaproteobacteria bacterium]